MPKVGWYDDYKEREFEDWKEKVEKMTDHRIIATDWQLQAAQEKRLGAVIVPLVPEPQETINTWVYPSAPIDLFWFKGEEIGERLYKALPYQLGDRLYLAEKWCKGDWGAAFNDDIYFTESTTPEAEHIGWQPAATMPPEAAAHWLDVTGVRVVQCKDVFLSEIKEAFLFHPLFDDLGKFSETTETRWSAAYPDQLWADNRWVVVMDVKLCQ